MRDDEVDYDDLDDNDNVEKIIKNLNDQIINKQIELRKIKQKISSTQNEIEEKNKIRESYINEKERKKKEMEELDLVIRDKEYHLNKSQLINVKFIDKLYQSHGFSNILKSTKEIEENQEAKDFIKNYENQNHIKILKSEKYKLIKHLGNLYISLEDLFNIDGLTFDRFQHKTANIKNIEDSEVSIPENDIENIISVFIYFRKQEEYFTEYETINKMIDLKNLKASRFSVLEYDRLFNITKKFSLLEMKEKAYKSFEVNNYNDFKPSLYRKENTNFDEFNNYILMDINMKWWPYNLTIYDEIEKKNLEKGFVLPNSKFFQNNQLINDQFKLILIHKNVIIKMLYEGKIPLEFVDDGQIATEPIKNLMKTLYSALESEIKLGEALKKIQYSTRKYIVNNEIKENLKKMLNEIYDEKLRMRENVKTNDLISSDRLNLINDDKSIIFKLNDATDLLSLNEKKELEDNSNKKKKKPKNFNKINRDEKENQLIEMQNMKNPNLLKDEIILDDISEFGKKDDNIKTTNLNIKYNVKKRKSNKQDVLKEELKRPLVNNETLNKLREKYPEIIDIFEGDLDKFMNYCQELIDEMHNKDNEFEFYKMHDQENNYDNNNEINDLSNMIIENIKNDGDLIKNKKIFYSNYETDKRFYINHLMEKYFDNENSDMKKIYKENLENSKKNEKNKSKKNEMQQLSDFNFEDSIKRGNQKFLLKVTEFLLIITIFVLCYLLLNNVKIKELSIFNSKILEIFDESDYCIDDFKQITTTSSLNSWMLDCYLPVIKTFLTTFNEMENSSRNSIYIFHSDIQIQYREFKKCRNSDDGSSNQTYNKFFDKCLDMTKYVDYNKDKYSALYDAGVKVIFNEEFNSGSFFDYLFFSRTTLDSYNLIELYSKETYLKFEKFLNTYNDQVPITSYKSQEEEFFSGNKDSREMIQIKNLIKKISSSRINDDSENISNIPSEYLYRKRIQLAFADPKVSQINISVFFINQDIDKLGVVIFKYIANDSNISTSVNNYACDIYYPFNQKDSDKLPHKTFYYFLTTFILMFALVSIAYLKLKISFQHSKDLINMRNLKRKKKQEIDIIDDKYNTINNENNYADYDNKGLKQNYFYEKNEQSNLENSTVKINNNLSNNIKELSKNDIQNNPYALNINDKHFEKAQMESIYKEKLWKIVNKSFFLSCSWIAFLYELLYRSIHILKGTFDGFFYPHLILDLAKRDGFLFFNNNIRLFKAIQVLFLSAHLIYVVFSYKKLTIIRKLFQKGLIIFYIVISIIILAISLIVYLILGNYLQEFNTLTGTFITLLGYSLGIESTDNIDVGNVSYLQDYILYLKILVYFIRLVVLNFSLIVMYSFYRKASTVQENKDKIKKESEKEKEYNRIKYNRLKRWLEKKNS